MLIKHEDMVIRFQRSLILFLVLLFVGCNDIKQSSSLGDVLDAGVLKVGTTYGLTTYYNGSTGPVGYEYELAEGFAGYLGVKLEVFPYYNLDDLFPQLTDAHLDMIAAGISVSPERFQRFKFGPGYQRVSEKLVFKQGKKWPRTIKDLKGELVIASGSSHHESLLRLQLRVAFRSAYLSAACILDTLMHSFWVPSGSIKASGTMRMIGPTLQATSSPSSSVSCLVYLLSEASGLTSRRSKPLRLPPLVHLM